MLLLLSTAGSKFFFFWVILMLNDDENEYNEIENSKLEFYLEKVTDDAFQRNHNEHL